MRDLLSEIELANKTATEMYNELVQMGHVVPSNLEPTALMTPAAYISVPTALAFATPPIPAKAVSEAGSNAKLESRSKGNKKRKGRARRR